MYTYSGTADGVTSSVPNNKQVLISSDPTATDFIDIENVILQQIKIQKIYWKGQYHT